MKLSYQSLCTEFYDLTKPEAGVKEVAFYETHLRQVDGPILEAMCGSGRLLIPLLRSGLEIDGCDNSHHMLESCSKRCAEQGLIAQLYNQSLKNLSLPKNYRQIFIAFGSFQLFPDRSEALQVLKNLRQHLLPSGRLIIETFVPWDEIKDTIEGDLLPDQDKTIPSERTAHSPEGFEIINRSQVTFYFKDQVETCQTAYEKWADGKLILAEEEEYAFRWYFRYEMELFLEKAGFSNVQMIDASFEKNPQAVIYVAS